MNTGALQVELPPSSNPSIHPRTWLDKTRVYGTLQFVDGPPESVAVLDTSKGPNQQRQNLPVAFDASSSTPFCWDFDSSFDAQNQITSQCIAPSLGSPGPRSAHGPSVIP